MTIELPVIYELSFEVGPRSEVVPEVEERRAMRDDGTVYWSTNYDRLRAALNEPAGSGRVLVRRVLRA